MSTIAWGHDVVDRRKTCELACRFLNSGNDYWFLQVLPRKPCRGDACDGARGSANKFLGNIGVARTLRE